MHVLYDCDNTMGLENRDIDDGLALIYLLEHDGVDLESFTLTFGNDSLANVSFQTGRLVRSLSLPLNPVAGLEEGDPAENPAACEIVRRASEFAGDVVLLATGSMHNLADALVLDPSLPEKVKSVVLMGGVTDDLFFAGKTMPELNFSVAPNDAFSVLTRFKNVSILTGNSCMDVPLDRVFFERLKLSAVKNRFLLSKIEGWMDDFRSGYGCDYIILWDVIAAVYLLHPEFFRDCRGGYALSQDDLKRGFMHSPGGTELNVPVVNDVAAVLDELSEKVFGCENFGHCPCL